GEFHTGAAGGTGDSGQERVGGRRSPPQTFVCGVAATAGVQSDIEVIEYVGGAVETAKHRGPPTAVRIHVAEREIQTAVRGLQPVIPAQVDARPAKQCLA